MKKNIIMVVFTVFFLSVISNAYAWNCGIFMTTDISGTDKDIYHIGENVYISGSGFDPLHANPETGCDWKVKRGGTVVASGTLNTDSSGNIPATLLYTTVPADAEKELKVYLECSDCRKLKDKFRVDEFQIPEFGLITASIAILGALGVLFVIRRKN